MAKKPDYVIHSAVALYCDESQMRRVNSFSADAAFMDDDVLELANNGVAETIDTLDTVSVTVDCHEFGSTENLAKAVNIFAPTTDTGASANKHYITDASFDNAQVEFMLKVTSGTNTSALAASCWFGSQWLTGFTLSYSADGNATESYTFEGEYKRWFMNSFRDMYVVSGTRTGATQATIYGKNLQTGYTPRVLTVNGLIASDIKAGGSNAITFTNSSSDTTVTATDIGGSNVTFQDGDRIRVIYAKNTPASFPSLSNTPAGIGALRKGMIDCYLYNGTSTTDANATRTLRLQSVSINAGLDRTAAGELGNKRSYTRTLNRPINVEVSCEAYLSDLEEYAQLANQDTAFDAMTLNEIDTDDFTNDTKLVVKLYKSETSHTDANKLKTITVDDLSVSADGFSIDTGGQATVSFTLTGTTFLAVGNSVSPII